MNGPFERCLPYRVLPITEVSTIGLNDGRVKPWQTLFLLCLIRTRSFSGLLLDSYPKLSQFQPINLLISFPSPRAIPGKGKCHTFDTVWIQGSA